ncbi:MAG: stage V sporulation protein AD [Clostridia bacterium]
MQNKRIGQQTIELPLRPALCGNAAFVGKKEGEGPLGTDFDLVAKDELYGQESFELAEKQLYLDAIACAIQKGGSKPENVQFLLGGDLLNQIITASFSARELGIPFIGLYGACSTMAESLCIGGMLLDGGHATQVVCAASSHFCTAERQYRYPLEFGSQRAPTAQWTVTGAGATLLCVTPKVPPLAHIARICMGRVIDLGISDANNMGAAMAPAAADTLLALLTDTQTTPADYDLIVTGDLGQVGHDLLLQLMREQRMPLDESKYVDCGLLIFNRDAQDVHAGGSGCGCSASVLNGHILPRIQRGDWKRVLFMATGALMSLTSSLQGESIPGVAHAVVLESPVGGCKQ